MRIRLLSVAHKAPNWIQEGYQEYAKRLPASCALELIEIPSEKRLLSTINPRHKIIALDVKGASWSTEQLAENMAKWQMDGRHVDLLIGGADGLSPLSLEKAEEKWSLSPLTFPHLFVRLIIAEQIYRAWSILQAHPYHRA